MNNNNLESKNSKISRKRDFLLILCLFVIIFSLHFPLANEKFKIGDGAYYLNMGINLFSGKGAVVSYNINQHWPGKYHPFLPHIQPIYPIIAGFIWFFLNSLKAVIGLNILLFSLNCILLYQIIRIKADFLTSFLAALFIGISKTALFTAIFPWVEQFQLFFILLAILIYLRYGKYFLVGIMLALSCLSRAPGILNVFVFAGSLIVLRGFSKESFNEYLKIALGFLLIFLPYEIFCYFKYGIFYPEFYFFKAGGTFTKSIKVAGAFYKPKLPVLNMPIHIKQSIAFNPYQHFISFIKTSFNIKFFMVLTLFYGVFDWVKRKSPLIIIFFFQGMGMLILYSLMRVALPGNPFGIARHIAFPFFFLSSIGFLAIKEIVDKLPLKRRGVKTTVLLVIVSVILFSLELKDYLPFRKHYAHTIPQKLKGHITIRKDMDKWIRTNTKEDDLIASDFLYESFLLDRPSVSLPQGKARTVRNMIDFLKIYKPEYIITPDANTIKFVKRLGFIEKKKIGYLVLLKAEGDISKLAQKLVKPKPAGPRRGKQTKKPIPQGDW